jgi:poly-gamma-glutamate capsule biosynthesis protein CapA/YwtB (metallophosphatase superfamily)
MTGRGIDQVRPHWNAPLVFIVNLETSVSSSPEAWAGKEVHYWMHPENLPCLTAACLDCCVLANNHVLDWGYEGLRETSPRCSRRAFARPEPARTWTMRPRGR